MMGCLQALFNQFTAKYSKDSIVFDNQLLFVPLGCIREYRQTMSNPILEKEHDLLLGFEKCVVGAYENMNHSKSKYLMSDSLKQYFLLALDLLCLLVRALDQHKYRLSLSELSDFEDELITFFDNVNKR